MLCALLKVLYRNTKKRLHLCSQYCRQRRRN